jgi:hypothetical protein
VQHLEGVGEDELYDEALREWPLISSVPLTDRLVAGYSFFDSVSGILSSLLRTGI